MARYYGTKLDQPEHDSERIVAKSFQSLPDEWVVIHSVTWQSTRNGRQGDGEADFILIHPNKGIIVLEVKGGDIAIKNGRWYSTDRNGIEHEILNPYDQAMQSKHTLLEWLRQTGLSGKVVIGHAVAFPHHNDVPFTGINSNSAITFTRTDLRSPEESLEKCIKHWDLKSTLTNREVLRVVGLLAPTVSVRRNLANHSLEAEDDILKLTAEQIQIFSGLRSTRGGLVRGNAGTGKTVLAIARAYQLAQEGFRTALLCYNELLGAELSSKFKDADKMVAGTFHSLCMREIRKAKLPLPASLNDSWWEKEAPISLLEACAQNETTFDAIVVDEGQDFSPAWIDSLRCLISGTKDAPFYIFADPKQELWGRDWKKYEDNYGFTFELSQNLRNSDPIAHKVDNLYSLRTLKRNINGPNPVWQMLVKKHSAEIEAINAVEKLIDEGFGPQNIVVLCGSSVIANRLRERIVGPYSLGSWGKHGIPIETIARFKGMECEAVILVLEDGITDADKMAAYVGISRARSTLMVIGTEKQKEFFNWSKQTAV